MAKDSIDTVEIGTLPAASVIITEKGLATPSTEEATDGGTRAWLQVVGSVFMFFNVWCVQPPRRVICSEV